MNKNYLIRWTIVFLGVFFPVIGEAVERPAELNGKVIGCFATPLHDLKAEIIMRTGVEPGEVVTFNDTAGTYAALRAGIIDGAFISSTTGRYYESMDEKVQFITSGKGAAATAHMAFRGGSQALKDLVDAGIDQFQGDGTLDTLQKEWINGLTAEKQSIGQQLPAIPNAPTYRVGVSGDFPPLDYMAADGKAAGYSVALLEEISRRSNVNFEIVPMTTEAKRIALNSGKVDALFIILIFDKVRPAFLDGALVSVPYFCTEEMGFLVTR